MAEYIELEKVLDDSNIITVQTKEYGSIEAIPVDTIMDIELSDVQPVKRGKWKQIAPQSAICSQCGGALKSNGIDKTGKGYIFKAVYKYCPYCGARMDGDTECQ